MRTIKSQIIVNADDLGASMSVNDRVFELMSKRAVTSATILANGPGVENALQRARGFPEHSFGVHLNVTEFEPLSDATALGPLLGQDASFQDNAVRRTALSPNLIRGIEREFDEQIRKVKDHGIPISHVDSHHHVHTIPQLFFALKSVQRRHHIQRIRISRNLYDPMPSPFVRLKKHFWNGALKYVSRTRTTEIFTDLSTFVRVAPKIDRSIKAELSVHPGNPDFAQEDELVESEWWADLPGEIELISYHDL